MKKIKRLLLVGMLTCSILIAGLSGCSPESKPGVSNEGEEADFPKAPVELIVRWSVGGGSSIFYRALAPVLEAYLGQPVKVVNIEGASGAVGMTEYFNRKADGYSIIAIETDMLIGSALGAYSKTWRDIDYLVRTSVDESIMFTDKNSPYQDFITLEKAVMDSPGKLRWGGVGYGSNEALVHAKLKTMGFDTVFVSYDGDSDLQAAVLRGEVDFGWGQSVSVRPLAQSGQVTAIAAFADRPVPGLEDVPLSKDLGYDLQVSFFRGIAVHKDVPNYVKEILEEALTKALQAPAWKQQMEQTFQLDPDASYMGSEEFTEFINTTAAFYEETVKDTGYQIRN